MPSPPAPLAPPVDPFGAPATRGAARAAVALALLTLVSGCGNRGDLYLASELDATIERDLEPLVPETLDPGESTDPSPLVPDGGIAPSVAPDPDTPGDDPEDDADDATAEERERRRDDDGESVR